jgi:Tfp pilus assembly protein PilO
MKQFWEQLRPGERRWVTGIGVVVFIVLNYFLVFPQFRQWRVNSAAMTKARSRITECNLEIARVDEYQRAINKFGDNDVPADDQLVNFVTFYQSRALENGIQIQSDSPRPVRTNEFFMEQGTTLDVVGGENNLVGFLYSLGSSASMMRVREMSLHAIEPNRYQLRASVTLVASYRKTSAKSAAPRTIVARPAVPQYSPTYIPNAVCNTLPRLTPLGSPAGRTNAANLRSNLMNLTNKPGPTKH